MRRPILFQTGSCRSDSRPREREGELIGGWVLEVGKRAQRGAEGPENTRELVRHFKRE